MASSATDSVIVWEWMNEYGRWKPYMPHVTQYIESNKSQATTLNLGVIDGMLNMYSIDFIAMCQIRLGTGTPRPVRRMLYPPDSPWGRGTLWQWEGDTAGEWHTYDADVARVIDDFFLQKGRSNILDLTHSSLNLPYQVNFSKMTQQRIGTGRQRNIRREKLTIPYPRISQGSAGQLISGHPIGLTNNIMSPNTVPNLVGGSSPNSPKQPRLASGYPHVNASPAAQLIMPTSVGATNQSYIHGTPTSLPTTTVSMSLPGSHISSATSSSIHFSGPLTRKRLHSSIVNNNRSNLPISSMHPSHSSGQNVNQPMIPGSGGNSSAHMISSLGSLPLPPIPPTSFSSPNIWMPNVINLHPQGYPSMYPGMSVPSSSQTTPTYSGALPIPGNLFNKSRSGSRISPVVSSATSILASPAVPLLLSSNGSSGTATSVNASSDPPSEGRIPNNVPKASKKQSSTDKSGLEVFEKYATVMETPPEEEDCCICCDKLTQPSGYGEGHKEATIVFQLSKCTHMFHKLCINAMYESGAKNGCVQCPTCKTIYGEKHGNCPRGVMEFHRLPQPLPGYSDCNTIRILYHIPPGIQGPDNPHPGKRYSTRGFPRVGFLPDNEKGRKVLKLLIVAWKRRLTFTIGTSTTTGESDTVTWNEIHHKTEFGTNYSGHGYPDPNYLENVLMELAVHGVTESDL
ncbi:E3 ubiquitin-protein ligase DTX4-like [Ylistrum balloti]|uniref:E3 ubiquitin-protein ligase DTX4-like n=1 Tax=Ylistrum balloti TaxID=509963 RepID=UPI002905AB55|nr:E3 ubiquitin-protein ligase DTX4-like [Ylistrum balloti]